WKPTIEITSPTDNEPVSGTIPIQVDASSFIGISKVEYYIDNTLKDTHTEVVQGTTYIYSWMTLGVEPYGDGPYTIKAVAYNTQNKTTQAEVSVVVNNSGNPEPQVLITSPANESAIRLQATIKADASDADPGGEIAKVEFYVDGTKVGEDTTNAYEYTWDATSVEDGEREIKVIAYDSISQRAEDSITVTVINHEEFEYVDKWSTHHPTDVALDKDGNLYVATNHTIKKYAPDGTLISIIENDSSYYNLSWWMFVAVDNDGNIYVSNSDRNQIIKFDPNGNYIKKWGTFGGGDNQFNWPSGIAADNAGNVYVCDEGNNRIMKYSSEGKLLDELGSQGGNDGEFNSPRGIAVDSSNNIYVTDHSNHRIQVLTSTGGFLRKWGNHGYDDNQFRNPTGIVLDSEGNVYIVDRNNYRIVKYTSDGIFLTKWGTQGSGDPEFECPQGIAVDSHFNVYVSDNCSNRITKFKSTWKPTCEIVFPTENSTIAATKPVTIQADVDSAVGISRVEFYINGTKEHEDTSGPSPYTYDWDTFSLPLPDGTYTIKAKAYNAEDKTVEDEISVVVNNTGDQAPSVLITNPQNEDIIRLTTTIEAEASDVDPGWITKVEFYVDGTKVGEDTGNPYSYTWDATTVEDGDKELKIIAYDSIDQMAEQSITVTVTNHEEFSFVDRWSRNNPIDVEVDKDGNIYVSGNHKISKYSPDGTLISEIEDNSSDYNFSWWMCITVDDFGNIYVTNEDRNTVIKFDSNGDYVKKWGSYGYGDYQFISPHDVAVDSQGNIYVVDHGNHRIVKYDSEGTYQTEWGSQGGSDGQFNWPWGIGIDDSDNIYITDQHNHRIQVFNSEGEFLRKWGNHGYADNQFRCPQGITFDSEGNLYIVDNCNYRIVKYTSTGTFLSVWGTRGNGNLHFECPSGIAVDANFNVYVADHCNSRVTIFRSIWLPSVEITNPFDNSMVSDEVPIQTNAASAVGISKVEFYINDTKEHEDITSPSPYTYNWDTSTLPLPDGTYTIKAKAYNIEGKTAEDEISVVVNNSQDKEPLISLTNPANEAVVRLRATIEAEASDVDGGIAKVEFYADGTLVTTSNVTPYANNYSYKYTWDATSVEDGETEVKVIAYDSIGQMAEASITVTVVNHEEFGHVDKWSRNNAVDLAVDKDGNLYVAGEHRVSKYSPDGTLIFEIEDNSNDYNFSWWLRVAVDESGNIYVSNSERHQIVKFDPNGNYVTKWGSYGYGDYRFNNPDGIATDSEGNVYVSDYHNNRIVKYDPEGTYLTELGSQGGEDGQFNNPQGIAIDDENYIYVVDRHNYRIQVFKPDGEFLRKWGRHGYDDDQLRCPEALALDSEGNVYVVDPCNYKVVKFTSGGTFVATWGTQGSGDLEFECPNGIAVDSLFNVYVADRCNGRITIFKSTWRPVVEITNPTDYEPVSGTVTIQADVETAIGISKVEFSIDETLMATVTEIKPGTEKTYEYNWYTITLGVQDGPYTLKAKAYNIEGKAVEDEISVVVNNSGNKAPEISITSPADGEVIRKTVDIKADATDTDEDGGIAMVEYYIENTLVYTVTAASSVYSWDTTTVGDGETEIKVIAYDQIGQNTSASIMVTVANQEAYEYVSKFSTWDYGHPRGVAVGKYGHIYATFCERIVKFTSTGGFLFRIDNEGSNNNYQLTCDMRIAVDDSGNIYVSCREIHTIVKFDPYGNFITKWGSQGSGDDQFNGPEGLDVDSQGNVYVCDSENHRIVKFDSDG
ncbi:6-bladed beta-propeller, partial [bacterium]|nr:6-bladed beta-propeller [bacterium]